VQAPGIQGITRMPQCGMITTRGGFVPKAYLDRVLVVRGSLTHPQTFVVNVAKVLKAANQISACSRKTSFSWRTSRGRAEELVDVALRTFFQAPRVGQARTSDRSSPRRSFHQSDEPLPRAADFPARRADLLRMPDCAAFKNPAAAARHSQLHESGRRQAGGSGMLEAAKGTFPARPGDVVEIEIIGDGTTRALTTVDRTVNLLPFAVGTKSMGLTLLEAKALLEKELAIYVKQPGHPDTAHRGQQTRLGARRLNTPAFFANRTDDHPRGSVPCRRSFTSRFPHHRRTRRFAP